MRLHVRAVVLLVVLVASVSATSSSVAATSDEVYLPGGHPNLDFGCLWTIEVGVGASARCGYGDDDVTVFGYRTNPGLGNGEVFGSAFQTLPCTFDPVDGMLCVLASTSTPPMLANRTYGYSFPGYIGFDCTNPADCSNGGGNLDLSSYPMWGSATPGTFDPTPPAWGGPIVGTSAPPAVPFCGAEITFTSAADTNGTVQLADPPFWFANAGDVLAYNWARTPGETGQIDITFNNTGWLPLVTESQIGSTGTGSLGPLLASSFGAGGNLRLTGALMRCRNVVRDLFEYARPGDLTTPADSDPRACARTTVVWPSERDVTDGDVLYWYLYANRPQLVEYATFDEAGAPGPLSALDWTDLADLDAAEFGSFPATAGFDGTLSQFILRCTDDDGTTYAGQWAPGVRAGGGDSDGVTGANGDTACFSSSGIGLNPSSWVPATGRMGSCLIRWTFIPPPLELDRIGDRVEQLRGQAPLQWVDEGISYVGDAEISFARWSDAGPACIMVMGAEVCPRTWDTNGSIPSWVVAALMFGLWCSLVFTVWRFF